MCCSRSPSIVVDSASSAAAEVEASPGARTKGVKGWSDCRLTVGETSAKPSGCSCVLWLRGSVLWGETLAVARIQEERSSDALAQFGKQSQIIAQLREELVEQEKKLRYEQNLSKQLRQKGQKLGRAAHNLLKTMFPPDSTTRPEKTMEWIAELTSATRRKAAQSLVLTLRADWDGYENTKASDIATAEEDEFPKE